MKDIRNVKFVYNPTDKKYEDLFAIVDGKKIHLTDDGEIRDLLLEAAALKNMTAKAYVNSCNHVLTTENRCEKIRDKWEAEHFAKNLSVKKYLGASVLAGAIFIAMHSGNQLGLAANSHLFGAKDNVGITIDNERVKVVDVDLPTTVQEYKNYVKKTGEKVQSNHVFFVESMVNNSERTIKTSENKEFIYSMTPTAAKAFDLYYNSSEYTDKQMYVYCGGSYDHSHLTEEADSAILNLIYQMDLAESKDDIMKGEQLFKSDKAISMWDKYCVDYFSDIVELVRAGKVNEAKKLVNSMSLELKDDYSGKLLLTDPACGVVLHVLSNALPSVNTSLQIPEATIKELVGEVDTERKGIMDNVCAALDARFEEFDNYCQDIKDKDNTVKIANSGLNAQIIAVETELNVLKNQLKVEKSKWFNGSNVKKIESDIVVKEASLEALKEQLQETESEKLLKNTLPLNYIIDLYNKEYIISHPEFGISLDDLKDLDSEAIERIIKDILEKQDEIVKQTVVDKVKANMEVNYANRPITQGGGKVGDTTVTTQKQVPVSENVLTEEQKETAKATANEKNGTIDANNDPFKNIGHVTASPSGSNSDTDGDNDYDDEDAKNQAAQIGEQGIVTGNPGVNTSTLKEQLENVVQSIPGATIVEDNSQKIADEVKNSMDASHEELKNTAQEAVNSGKDVTVATDSQGNINKVEIINKDEKPVGSFTVENPDGTKDEYKHSDAKDTSENPNQKHKPVEEDPVIIDNPITENLVNEAKKVAGIDGNKSESAQNSVQGTVAGNGNVSNSTSDKSNETVESSTVNNNYTETISYSEEIPTTSVTYDIDNEFEGFDIKGASTDGTYAEDLDWLANASLEEINAYADKLVEDLASVSIDDEDTNVNVK